jgi:hypothetical protein
VEEHRAKRPSERPDYSAAGHFLGGKMSSLIDDIKESSSSYTSRAS